MAYKVIKVSYEEVEAYNLMGVGTVQAVCGRCAFNIREQSCYHLRIAGIPESNGATCGDYTRLKTGAHGYFVKDEDVQANHREES